MTDLPTTPLSRAAEERARQLGDAYAHSRRLRTEQEEEQETEQTHGLTIEDLMTAALNSAARIDPEEIEEHPQPFGPDCHPVASYFAPEYVAECLYCRCRRWDIEGQPDKAQPCAGPSKCHPDRTEEEEQTG